jgi:hypothetical protein
MKIVCIDILLIAEDPNQNRKDIHPNKFLQFLLEADHISDERQNALEIRVI